MAMEQILRNMAQQISQQFVKDFFSGKPFRVRLDSAHGLRRLVRDLLDQAKSRQKKSTGTSYVGAVMQHLVGAKFECVLEPGTVEHNSFSTADAPAGRAGDFVLGDVAVHVTTALGESVIVRCRTNLNGGFKPVLITVPERMATAQGLLPTKVWVTESTFSRSSSLSHSICTR